MRHGNVDALRMLRAVPQLKPRGSASGSTQAPCSSPTR